MVTRNEVPRLYGLDVYGSEGRKIGSTEEIYLDDRTGEPEWLAVGTGLFGAKQVFVPLRRASVGDDRITVPYDKSKIKDAPRIDPDGRLTPEQEEELYRYYNVTGDYEKNHRGRRDDAMTRSEERLVTGTRTEEVGKARLRKYVVTEQEQVNVPVTREEVRLEREPITDANRGSALAGDAISEAEHEVTLRAERPVVDTEAVPVERVRLGKEKVRDSERVSGQVRKERIDFQD